MLTEIQKIHLISFSMISLVIIYSYFQGYLISSQRVFMCLIYCSLLITLYFTYSVKVARKMITKQIRLIVDNIKNIMSIYQIKNKYMDSSQNDKSLQDTEASNLQKKNKKIHNKSIIIIVFCFLFSFIISFLIWAFRNQKHKMYNIKSYGNKVILKNIIILVMVLITQLIFSSLLVANILPLDSKDIIQVSVDSILNDNNVPS